MPENTTIDSAMSDESSELGDAKWDETEQLEEIDELEGAGANLTTSSPSPSPSPFAPAPFVGHPPRKGGGSINKPPNLQPVTGVPSRPIDLEAEKLKQRVALPIPPGTVVEFDVMQEWLAKLTPEMWQQIIIYAYRKKPVIDRGLTQPGIEKPITNIDKLVSTFSKEEFIQTHGGGEYTFRINNARKTMFQARLTISQSEHRPKLDYREIVLDDPSNYHYVRKLMIDGILNDKGEVVATQPTIVNSGNSDTVVKELSGILNKTLDTLTKTRSGDHSESEGMKAMSQIMVEKMKQDNPNTNIIPMMLEVMKTNNAVDPSQGRMFEMMMTLLTAMMSQSQTMQTQMFTILSQQKADGGNGGGGAGDPVKLFDRFLDLQAKLLTNSKLQNGGGEENRDWVDKAIDGVERIGPMFAPLFAGLGAKLSGVTPGQAVPPVNMPQQPQQPAPTGYPQLQPSQQMHEQRTVNLPQLQHEQPQGTQMTEQQIKDEMRNQLYQTLIGAKGLLLTRLQSNIPGYEIARSMEVFGLTAEIARIRECGQEMIVQTMLAIPEYAQFGQQFLSKWVSDFVNYEDVLAQLEGGEITNEVGEADAN